jgi:hypothetical protein
MAKNTHGFIGKSDLMTKDKYAFGTALGQLQYALNNTSDPSGFLKQLSAPKSLRGLNASEQVLGKVLSQYFNIDNKGNITTNGNIEDIAKAQTDKYNQSNPSDLLDVSDVLGNLVGDYGGTHGLVNLINHAINHADKNIGAVLRQGFLSTGASRANIIDYAGVYGNKSPITAGERERQIINNAINRSMHMTDAVKGG